MSPASVKSQLLSKVRNQYSVKRTQSSVSDGQQQSQQPIVKQAKNQSLNQHQSVNKQTDKSVLDTTQKLDILDNVLTEVESKTVTTNQSTQVHSVEQTQQLNQKPQIQQAPPQPQPQPQSQPQPQPQQLQVQVQQQQASNQALPQQQVPQRQSLSATDQNINTGSAPSAATEEMGVVGQAFSQTAQEQQFNDLNPPPEKISTGQKERVESGQAVVETGTALQYVEQEKQPEIPPEVEKFVNKVEQEKIEAPQEVVVADQQQATQNQHYAAEPVIVLPITPEVEKKNKRKSPKYSVKWLIEWSQKIVKMFAGKVIYRHAEQ